MVLASSNAAQRLQIVDLIPGESYWVLRSGINESEWYVYHPVYAKFLHFSKNNHPFFQTQLGSTLYPTSFFHYYEELPTNKMRCKITMT